MATPSRLWAHPGSRVVLLSPLAICNFRPEAPISSAIYEEVISGRTTRERKMAVCTGSAGLTPAEWAELLTVLGEDADESVRERAENALLSQPVEAFASALGGEHPSPQLLRYCGTHFADEPSIAAALIKSGRCPV